MDIRAWGVGALVLMAGVHPVDPVDSGGDVAACELLAAVRAVPAGHVDHSVLIAAEVPTAAAPAATGARPQDEEWLGVPLQARPQYAVQPNGSTVAPFPAHPRNPAGQLVLPVPQTSRAPAF